VSDTEDTNPRVRSPLQDPEHEAILVHFEHRVDLLFSQLKEWIGEQLRETNSAVRQTHVMAERAIAAGLEVVTMRDQLEVLLGRCQRMHGPIGSIPPSIPTEGNGTMK
jgi:hypothetical protein